MLVLVGGGIVHSIVRTGRKTELARLTVMQRVAEITRGSMLREELLPAADAAPGVAMAPYRSGATVHVDEQKELAELREARARYKMLTTRLTLGVVVLVALGFARLALKPYMR